MPEGDVTAAMEIVVEKEKRNHTKYSKEAYKGMFNVLLLCLTRYIPMY